ncbi:MAG: DinB family protein [Candidatus Eisenbacteria bacterium]|uniref:DinB family protein n=1 Tax=Eiseniibacteriota bacterium TaxID=2212470 RepID=A0A9D6QLX6_UNCEI|nr:DinB family protein [Candidatus Eisenbacteria bacterium]MBI3539138.1 DinB family protein [Candidatus Eisenbacteria bacterium]
MTRQDRDRLIAQYAEGVAEVTLALEGFPASGLTHHAVPGKWSAAEIVHHLADSETTSALRIRKLLAEDHPVIHGYDQEGWAKRLRYNERDIAPSLAAFRAARETTTQVLQAMSEADWGREGWHTESGRYSAETWLAIYAVHAHNHAAQIRRQREALAKR